MDKKLELAYKYHNCNVQVSTEPHINYKLAGIDTNVDKLLLMGKSGRTYWVEAKLCNLILKDLADITDEDLKILVEIYGHKSDMDFMKFNISKDPIFYEKEAYYLRSKNYDIDNAIQNGYAVNEKEVIK